MAATTTKAGKGTTIRVKVPDVAPEQKIIADFVKAKQMQSKGRKGEKTAVAAIGALLDNTGTAELTVTGPDGVNYVAGHENKKSDPKATAWDAYIASLSPEEAKAAMARFHAPNVERKTHVPYIRKV